MHVQLESGENMKPFNLSSEDILLISTFPICSEMTKEEIVTFSKHLTGIQFTHEERIFEQESKANDHLFIILGGEVYITTKLTGLKKELSITNQRAGSIVGILSFIDGRSHKASAYAFSPVRTVIVTRDIYQHFKDNHPRIATKMLQYLIVSADDLACQFLNKLSASQEFMLGITTAKGKS